MSRLLNVWDLRRLRVLAFDGFAALPLICVPEWPGRRSWQASLKGSESASLTSWPASDLPNWVLGSRSNHQRHFYSAKQADLVAYRFRIPARSLHEGG